jgi:hypothetical protein
MKPIVEERKTDGNNSIPFWHKANVALAGVAATMTAMNYFPGDASAAHLAGSLGLVASTVIMARQASGRANASEKEVEDAKAEVADAKSDRVNEVSSIAAKLRGPEPDDKGPKL